MGLTNLMEEEVRMAVNKYLKDNKNCVCQCEKCKSDIMAIVLNNLKPKYVVTDKGKVYGKLDTLDFQFDVDLTREIVKAIEIVSKTLNIRRSFY